MSNIAFSIKKFEDNDHELVEIQEGDLDTHKDISIRTNHDFDESDTTLLVNALRIMHERQSGFMPRLRLTQTQDSFYIKVNVVNANRTSSYEFESIELLRAYAQGMTYCLV